MSEITAFQSNAANAWIFNGNNGYLNNGNNRINANYARVFRDSCFGEWEAMQAALVPLSVIYFWYYECRKGKRRSLAQIRFERYYPGNLEEMWRLLNDMEYVLRDSSWFIIHYPKLREVIAPDFFDRPPQTLWCETMRPYVERRLDPDSYACRAGRGALRAVSRLVEYYYEESEGGTAECVFIKIDQKSFFLHIDKPMLVDMYAEIIEEEFAGHPWRDFMLWLCRILYLSCPAEHMRRECPVSEGALLPPHKRMENLPWWIGLAIGNLIAQMGGNLFSTLYLAVFRHFGYRFVHYTDDVILPLKRSRLEQFKRIFIPTLRIEEAKAHLEINENKTYIQGCGKGVSALGFFIKAKPDGIVVLPGKRIVFNFKMKLRRFLDRGRDDKMFRLKNKEHFRDTMNSYYGNFKHCNSYELREKYAKMILSSGWDDVLDFKPGYACCFIRKNYTIKAYHAYKNRQFKKYFNHYDYTGKDRRAGEQAALPAGGDGAVRRPRRQMCETRRLVRRELPR